MLKKMGLCLLAGNLAAYPVNAESTAKYYFGTGFSYRILGSHGLRDEKRYIQRKRASHDMVLGYRLENGRFFYGPEINVERFRRGWFTDTKASQSCEAIQQSSYYCARRSTYRVRGIFGRKVGQNAEVYAALGMGVMKGYGAIRQGRTSLGINAGVTVGLGVQYRILKNGMLRAELVYDNYDLVVQHPTGLDGERYSPSYEATTIKVSYILNF
ncbi:hypothetical protein [Profundibacter sp.]